MRNLICEFYGTQGHSYDCFHTGFNYNYIFICHIDVAYVVKEVVSLGKFHPNINPVKK